MKGNIFYQKKINENNLRNISYNDRYKKRNLILINSSNSKTASTISSIRKIEDLKRKYNNMDFQQKLHLKNTFNKILRLKNKYNSLDKLKSKTIDTEANDIKTIKSKEKLLIQNTGQLSLINPNSDKDLNSNLYLHTISGINGYIPKTDKNDLRKSNEINYQFKSKKTQSNFNLNKIRKLNIKMLKNSFEKNNKTIREELLKFRKSVNNFLNENKENDNKNKQEEVDNYFNIQAKSRNKSECPIKERINKLNSVKKKIKKINDFLFRENEKNNNLDNSFDSQADLDFKHIKPKIMKDNSIEEYFKEEQSNKYANDNISKPVLIKAFPRPKLNMPKFPSFFHKSSK